MTDAAGTGRGSDRIESPRNPRLRAALELRDRRARDERRCTLVDGVREVTRALDAGATLVEAFVTPDPAPGSELDVLVGRLRTGGVPLRVTAPPALARLGFGEREAGIVAVARTPDHDLAGLALLPRPLVVVVEGIEKPGNLGAILRSADGAGADALIVADPGTDLANPNVIRASLGTVFSVRCAVAPAPDVRRRLDADGLRIVAARPDADRPYTDADLTGGIAIVLGAEATGLSSSWSGRGIEAVRLPMLGIADSLNVSVAAAVLLYEARRQRGLPPSRV